MSDLSFTTSPARRDSSRRRVRGAVVFLALLACAIGLMLFASMLAKGW
jgi:hypothetical protein